MTLSAKSSALVTRELLKELDVTQVRLGESLARHTYLKIGGKADILVFPRSVPQVQWTVECAYRFNLPFVVMGNGSNLLVRDGGVRGIVIALTRLAKIRRSRNFVFAEAGAPLATVSTFAQQNGLGGLEFACGIPGTVGGGVAMNAGAYGNQMSDVLDHVVVLTRVGQLHTLTNTQLHLTYRSSVINECGCVVLESAFRLTPRHPDLVLAAMDDFTGGEWPSNLWNTPPAAVSSNAHHQIMPVD